MKRGLTWVAEARRAVALTAISLACIAACDPKDSCSVDGAEWCDDNTPHACVENVSTGLDWEEHTHLSNWADTPCDEYGATCYEAGDTSAYCAYLDLPCPSGTPSLCVGNVVAECTEQFIPMPVEDCADTEMVCSTDGPGLGAECVSP
jgi:hypothetical protein